MKKMHFMNFISSLFDEISVTFHFISFHFFGGRGEEERRGIVDLRPRNTRD
jgi:hypothetical protein